MELPAFLPGAEFKLQHAAALADQLRKDQTRCKEGRTHRAERAAHGRGLRARQVVLDAIDPRDSIRRPDQELLPWMGTTKSTKKPMGYIVNVSSREGIFDDVANSRSKAGRHVHTNMSKAAINMITETEATAAWNTRRVALNSVDPGYMSAAPDCQPRDGCPIGFEDGAARVLRPIVVGEREGRVISGRFLKHFEEGAAIIRRGV